MYKPGKFNHVADALSRCYEEEKEEVVYSNQAELVKGSMLSFSIPINSLIEDIGTFNSNSVEVREFRLKMDDENLKAQHYKDRNGLIMYKGKLMLFPGSELIMKVIKEFHDSYIGGHSGVDRTFSRIVINF